MKKRYVILGTEGMSWGACVLITKELWDVYDNKTTVDELSEKTVRELVQYDIKEGHIEADASIKDMKKSIQIAFTDQEYLYCLIANNLYVGAKLKSAMHFSTVAAMANYVRENNIMVVDSH